MTTKVIATEDLDMEALTLGEFLTKHILEDYSDEKNHVYVQDDAGRIFARVTLVQNTLTDGSITYDVVLS